VAAPGQAHPDVDEQERPHRAGAPLSLDLVGANMEILATQLPRNGRKLHVLVPCDDCEKQPGPVPMRALVDARGLGGVAPDEVRWTSSIQGELGQGFDVAPVLERGEHEIIVSAPDGLGNTLSARAIIIVGGKGR